MKNKVKTTGWKWLGAALLAVAGLSGQARAAATTSYLNIDVTISGTKSVTVNGVASSTDATSVSWTTPNQVVPAPATTTVRNTSGVLNESWELSTNASALSAGVAWSQGGSSTTVGTDVFALQAVFGSSNTTAGQCAGSASWGSGTIAPLLTASPVLYNTAGTFADSALNTNGLFNPDTGSTMFAYNATTGAGQRALCWRLIMPQTTTATSGTVENIQVVVTAF